VNYDSNGNLDLFHGFVPLTPYGGASVLGGGGGTCTSLPIHWKPALYKLNNSHIHRLTYVYN
jgi:hypothetical protein